MTAVVGPRRRGRLPIEVVVRAHAFWRDGCAEPGSARLLALERTLADEASPQRRALIARVAGSAEQAIAVAVDCLILRSDAADETRDLIMSALWAHAARGHPAATAAYERFRSLLAR